MAQTTTLPITWQRLVKDGQTCNRCGSTEQAVANAVATLTDMLRPLDIVPVLTTIEIPEETFVEDTVASNQITIAGKTLEHWLGGETGASECSSVCGTNQCRTVEVDGQKFEAIPEQLIIKAGILAAMSEPPTEQCGCSKTCSTQTAA